MKIALTTTILSTALAAGLAAQSAPHSVATVNDPRSHGTLGDNFLSLFEVMELNMGRLQESQLSAAEKTQLSGFGTDIAWADIDTSKVPVLTLQRDLPMIEETPHGLVIAGSNGTPVIDISGTRGFVAESNFIDFRNVKIRGGATAIKMTQYDGIYGSVLEEVEFEGQSVAALAVEFKNPQGQNRGEGRLQIDHCVFPNIPKPVVVTSVDPNRSDTLIITNTQFRNSTVPALHGVLLQIGGAGRMVCNFERLQFDGIEIGIEIREATGPGRRLLLDTAGITVRRGRVGFQYFGDATADSQINLRMLDVEPFQRSVLIAPLPPGAAGTKATINLDDSRLKGIVEIQAGAQPVTLGNLRTDTAALKLGSTGGAIRVVDSILENSTITTTGNAPVQVEASRFVNGTVTGSASAPVTVLGSHLGGVTIGAHASSTNPLAAAQLGSMDVVPLQPKIGTTMTLQADLPPSLTGFWIIGDVARQPDILARPLHLYFDVFFYVVWPNTSRGQSSIPVPIPNNNYFVGRDMAIQMVVIPDSGFPAPPLSLPPGRYIQFSR